MNQVVLDLMENMGSTVQLYTVHGYNIQSMIKEIFRNDQDDDILRIMLLGGLNDAMVIFSQVRGSRH